MIGFFKAFLADYFSIGWLRRNFGHADRTFSLVSKSEEQLQKEFDDLDEVSARKFYVLALSEIKNSVSADDIDSFKTFRGFLNYVSATRQPETVRNYQSSALESHGNINLVTLACKSKAVEVLEHLLSNENDLYSIPFSIDKNDILLDEVDDECHNAFYYAIRSNSLAIPELLINMWPNVYFNENPGKLDAILSRAYRELMLRNVHLTEGMKIYVERKLVDSRFFHDKTQEGEIAASSADPAMQRIDLVLESIAFVRDHFQGAEAGEQILLAATFVAKNIHLLKSLLKSTYDRLPWEEMEFYLIIFIRCCSSRFSGDVVYNFVSCKQRLLRHLGNFSDGLKSLKGSLGKGDIGKLSAPLYRLKRDKAIQQVIENNPSFRDLYDDFLIVRDYYTLEVIRRYINWAMSGDPTEKEGQLVITRALQVTGEHMKNTLYSPKLSHDTLELLNSSLPGNTKEIIAELRDSLSHAESLSTRLEIEDNVHHFFSSVQSDLAKIDSAVISVLQRSKMRVVGTIVGEITACEDFDKVTAFLRQHHISQFSLGNEVAEMRSFNLREVEQLEKLVSDLDGAVDDKSDSEKGLFRAIHHAIQVQKSSFEEHKIKFDARLGAVEKCLARSKKHISDISMRFLTLFEKMSSPQIFVEPSLLSNSGEIQSLWDDLDKEIRARTNLKNKQYALRAASKIDEFMNFRIGKIKSIKEFKHVVTGPKKKKSRKPCKPDDTLKDQLTLKVDLLRKVLKACCLENLSCENGFVSQPLMEILVLDIFSALESLRSNLTHNAYFLDCDYPMANGKILRNHLAHENSLVNILLGRGLANVVLNAEKITSEDVLSCEKQIGKKVKNDPVRLKKSHHVELSSLRQQRKLFTSLMYGDLKQAKDCISNGADVCGRDMDLQTPLHFAAKGPGMGIVKFVLQFDLNPHAKDANLQTALHVSATFGRVSVVQYFIDELKMTIDGRDTQGKTPLHVASENGHEDVVRFLLERGANPRSKDMLGKSPLHYAFSGNFYEVARVLLEKETDVDALRDSQGFTALHAAAASGHLNLVNVLLEKNANVGLTSTEGTTPLHLTARGGHAEIAKSLIARGADVDARCLGGCTPLHEAVHDEATVSVLLGEGADVNARDSRQSTPLLHAACFRNLAVARLLLENGAVMDAKSDVGDVPWRAAALSGHRDFVLSLLNEEPGISGRTGDDAHILLWAVLSGHLNLVGLLVHQGTNIHATWDETNRTALHCSAILGHKHIAEFLIDQGAHVDAQDSDERTALHYSAAQGHRATAHMLLRKGADVLVKDRFGLTPLYILTRADMTDILIEEQVDINYADDEGLTPLHYGATTGDLKFVEYCLARGIDINTKSKCGSTALQLALQKNHAEVVRFLLQQESCTDASTDHGFLALCNAVAQNSEIFVRKMLPKEPDAEKEMVLLMLAVRRGCGEVAEYLLTRNITEAKELPLLHKAALYGHVNVVEVLIKSGFDVNAEDGVGTTPLVRAVGAVHYELVQFLISKGADPNRSAAGGATALQLAVFKDSPEMVNILLRAGADDVQYSIEVVIKLKHVEIFKLLLEHPAVDVDARGSDGFSLLHSAAYSGSLEMTKCLVDKGANVDVICSGSKPVHLAAMRGHEDIVRYFFALGLGNDNLGAGDWTLLHCAVVGNQPSICKFLLEMGADVNAFDEDGFTPFHFAAEMGRADILHTLMHHGSYYDVSGKNNGQPLLIANNQPDAASLRLISELFTAARKNDLIKMELLLSRELIGIETCYSYIRIAKNMLLHYASRKGFEDITNILLKYEANPNFRTKNGCTPMHYASKFSHFGIVMSLLRSGAVFEAVCDAGRTPVEFAEDRDIVHILTFLKVTFRKTQNGDAYVLESFDVITDVDTAKAVMAAKNQDGETLVEIAAVSNHAKVRELKWFLDDLLIRVEQLELKEYVEVLEKYSAETQKDVTLCRLFGRDIFERDLFAAQVLFERGVPKKAADVLRNVYETRKELQDILSKESEEL